MLKRIIGFVLLAVVPFTFAQNVMEEIVVLAQKREQTLQEVPVAVSVVSSATMDRAQINDIIDLQSVVPSLRVTQLQTSSNTNFVIRGFGNGANNPGIEPSVGVFVDGVYRSRSASALADLPNLERVEVLRGPQSTLFGKNASAGVINVVTSVADPATMDGPSGSVSVTAGDLSQILVRADVTAPLSDSVGFSLSGYSHTRDGYFKNLSNGSDLNERSRAGVRGEISFFPNDSVSIRVIADADEIDEKCCGVANLLNGPTGPAILLVGGKIVPNDAFIRQQYYDFDPTSKIGNSGISMQMDIDLPNEMLLTSITSYRTLDLLENVDVDFTSAALISRNIIDTEIETFTQELRLSYFGEKVDWIVGGFYFDEDVSHITDLDYGPGFRLYGDLLSGFGVTSTERALNLPFGTFFGVNQGVFETAGQSDRTFSIFAQTDFRVADKLTLTLGANYTDVDKSGFLSQNNTDIFSNLDFEQLGFGLVFTALTGLPPTPAFIAAVPAAAGAASAISVTPCSAAAPPPFCNQLLALRALQFLPQYLNYPNAVESGKSPDSKTTWTARIAYDVSDTVNTYASVSTGFKATSWNLSRDSRPFARDMAALAAAGLLVPNINAGTRFAAPEESTVRELGIKGKWGQNYINVALFDQDIDNFQSNVFTGVAFNFANAGRQSTTGLEIDGRLMPSDSFEIVWAATFLNPIYDSFVTGAGVSGIEDLSGTKPAGVHKSSISIAGTYFFTLSSSVNGFIRADMLTESDVQVNENVPISVASRDVRSVNASVSFTFKERYELMFWGRNLTSDDYLQSSFPSVAQSGSYSGYPNQPRTYGVTFRTHFD
jgi:iron complex outermembrane receptor protein